MHTICATDPTVRAFGKNKVNVGMWKQFLMKNCPKKGFKIVLIMVIIFIVHVLQIGKLTWMKEGHSHSCQRI